MGFFKKTENSIFHKLPQWFNGDDAHAIGKLNTSASLTAQLRGEAKRVWSIRKREFDKLRTLRQNQMITGDKPKQRFFHTSMLTDLREKTSTIKKIDEIEAQMSMQWWKTDRLDASNNT
jgi:hypothetical protein